MSRIYLDNAATTPMLPEVVQTVTEAMVETFGNPSSTHQIGRQAKAGMEEARKRIAARFNAAPGEIYFTAGGSEADNLILYNAVCHWGVKRILSTVIEHHAVLHSLQELERDHGVILEWIGLTDRGDVDLEHLETLLKESDQKTLVSLMYVNNEIGNLLDVDQVCSLCRQYDALFHSDAVQAVGHFEIDIERTPIDFFAASAHKFHGPKGVGFAYVRKDFGLSPLLHGGSQERGSRAGTENVQGILGMEKALDVVSSHMESDMQEIQELKSYLIDQLKMHIEGMSFNGYSDDPEKSSYIILNVRFPKNYPMLLFQLDIAGIAVSGGSACQSGSDQGSHVLNAILDEEQAAKTSVRFSFSKLNTKEEIDQLIVALKKLVN
jgi:cysteine desulfurase